MFKNVLCNMFSIGPYLYMGSPPLSAPLSLLQAQGWEGEDQG